MESFTTGCSFPEVCLPFSCCCRRHVIPREDILSWMNAVALIITALPDKYWTVVFTSLVKELQTSRFLAKENQPHINPFEVILPLDVDKIISHH